MFAEIDEFIIFQATFNEAIRVNFRIYTHTKKVVNRFAPFNSFIKNAFIFN